MREQYSILFEIAGIHIRFETEIPIPINLFNSALKNFITERTGFDTVVFRHHFSPLPDKLFSGEIVYDHPPFQVMRNFFGWLYKEISVNDKGLENILTVQFNDDYSIGDFYHKNSDIFASGNSPTITFLPSDQAFISQLLLKRQGCYVHSTGLVINKNGLLFVGHSGAGKSTITKMLIGNADILCDDRIIVRDWPDGFKIHGTWNHGELPYVSPESAPLKGIFFLEKANINHLIPISRKELIQKLPFFIIKPLVSTEWWEKTLDLVERIAREVPAYRLQFDKSGEVKDILLNL